MREYSPLTKRLEIALKTLKMIRDSDSDASEFAGKTIEEIIKIDEDLSEVKEKLTSKTIL